VGTRLEAWFASDGTLNAPQGVRGGQSGGASGQFKRTAEGDLVPVPPCGGVVLEPGETIYAVCCGGGGYGDPRARHRARVEEDVEEGRLSRERALAVYGWSAGE
jgi:N-methylhydantoinase B